MVSPAERFTPELAQAQQASMATAFPDFRALEHLPQYLGLKAHSRLEGVLNMPVASDTTQPDVSIEQTGQTEGVALGALFGQEREFVRNLPEIKGNIAKVAEESGESVAHVWDMITEILEGSGVARPMHRTLTRPVGGETGARDYMQLFGTDGMMMIVRKNVANWGARRQDLLMNTLGRLPEELLPKVELIVYAGADRTFNGAGELWRPEVRPFVRSEEVDGKTTELTDLTEATSAELIDVPETEALLAARGLSEAVQVKALAVHRTPGAEKPATGVDVVRAIGENFGDRMRNLLVVEMGNAPAGYTQLQAAANWVEDFGLQPDQYLAMSDGTTIVHPDHFDALDASRKSRVQNAATALNSFNGWLSSVAQVNRLLRSSA